MSSNPRFFSITGLLFSILLAAFLAWAIRTYLGGTFWIPSHTMHPSLIPGDVVFADKTAYCCHTVPEKGDLIIFSSPKQPGRYFIKRVVATAGETVSFRNGELFINGVSQKVPLKDPSGRTPSENKNQQKCWQESLSGTEYTVCNDGSPWVGYGPVKVPEGQVFVYGDLRTRQMEPKVRVGWGKVPHDAVLGKIRGILMSWEPGHFLSGRWSRFLRRIP